MTSEDSDKISSIEAAGGLSVPLETPERQEALLSDGRPRMAQLLPVRLVTVSDAHLNAAAGLEVELDAFYIDLLGFERAADDERFAYRAENYRILFDVIEPPIAVEDMRPLGVEIQSLRTTERQLIDAEIEYVFQKGLNPGQESILLRDPAGNWIQLSASSKLW